MGSAIHLARRVAHLQARDRYAALRGLTAGRATNDIATHLVDQSQPTPRPHTVCGDDVDSLCALVRIWSDACPRCVELALQAGYTVAREGNALVNLQRLASPES